MVARGLRPAVAGIVMLFVLPAAGPAAAEDQPTATTERVSVGPHGRQAEKDSGVTKLSDDGRWVVFTSPSKKLVRGHTGRYSDVFRHDRTTDRTVLISAGLDGEIADAASRSGGLSRDGNVVSFDSFASNLVPGDSNGQYDVFVRRVKAGATELMSIGFDGSPADNWSVRPNVSASGRYVAWDSYATNLVADDTNGGLDVFLRDRKTDTTERVSVTSQETQANGESTSAAMSADGRFVVFESGATNLSQAVDDNGTVDVFLRDRLYGTTELLSIGLDGTAADGLSLLADVSDDGRYVAFVSTAADHVPNDTNGVADVFVRDRLLDTTTRVSVATGGEQAGGCGCFMIAISGNGRHVAFDSDAADLVDGDTNGKYDVFVHNLKTGVTTRVSVSGAGGQGNFASIAPAISRTGDVVGFQSGATNLVPDDTNDAADVFVRVR